MKKTFAIVTVLAIGFMCSAYGEYGVSNTGTWPKTWPEELEPLRKQAQTYDGPIDQLRYLIPFTKRVEFESAWPHILKVKSKGAPIILMRGPRTDFFAIKPAGVLIQMPDQRGGRDSIVIELAVDGEIVDLNRIPLPPDTPIIDKRFDSDGKPK
jgi:hypothetical protein